MLIIFYGDNNFITKRKLKDTIENYKKKHKSGMSFFSFSANDLTLNKFKDAVETISMFNEKKCVVLNDVFFEKDNASFLVEYIKENKIKERDDVFVVLKEDEIKDKKDENFKWLCQKPSLVYESNNLNTVELKKWIEKEAAYYGASVSNSALDRLVFLCGNDLWMLANQVQKLSAYDKKITESSIEELVPENIESDIFKAIEFLASRNKKGAIDIFYKQIRNGKNVQYIVSMIVFQFRNLMKVKDLSDKGVFGPEIAKKAKLHPFVVQKTLGNTKNYSLSELKYIYDKLLDLDIKTKTSSLDPRFMLDLFILGL